MPPRPGGEGLSPIVFTSGRALDGKRASELRPAGLVGAFVSLDPFVAHEHDRTRRVEDGEAMRAWGGSCFAKAPLDRLGAGRGGQAGPAVHITAWCVAV